MADLLKDFGNYDDGLEKKKDILSGLLGLATDGQRRVNHPTRNGYVYVRLRDNLSEVVLAFNDKVSPVYDFPVVIQRKNNGWIVLGRDTERYSNWGTSAPFLPQHGDQHSFNRDGAGGGDVVWVYPDQIEPLLVYPSGTFGAPNVIIAPYMLQRTNDFLWVGNTGTTNLVNYRPTDNQAIMGLVYIDTVSGNPGFLLNSGTPFSASLTGSSQIFPYIPYPSSTQEPLYAVRLVSGTTTIQWANLYNARQFIGDKITLPIGSDDVLMPGFDEATGTYTHQTDFSIRGSSGVSVGQPVQYITATGTQSINVSGGVGYIRSSNAQTGDLGFCSWQSSGSILIPSPTPGGETTRFIGVAYNGGNPQITVRTTFNWNWYDDFPLGRVSYDGNTLHILNTYAHAEDTANLTRKFLRTVFPFQREQAPEGTGGLEVSDVPTRQVTMSGGIVHHGFNAYTLGAIVTGTSFDIHYRTGTSGFIYNLSATQWPNTQYDNGSGVLVTMGNNKYACLWWYLDISDGTLNIVMGRNEYNTSSLAQAETIPSTVPPHLQYHGRLVSRFIFQKSATSATLVESAWQSEFIGSAGGGGGSSNLPVFITGSIPFALPDGTLTEDSRLHWENNNGQLWLNGQPPTFFNANQLPLTILATGSNTSTGYAIITVGTGTLGSPSGIVNAYRARGTYLLPTPVQTGDRLMSIVGGGFDGVTWQNSTRIAAYADGNFITGTYVPSRFDFEVVPSGSATRAVIAELRGDGFNLKNTGTYNINGVPHTHGSSGIPSDGWDNVSYTVNYASSDSPSFVVNVQANVTGSYGLGTKWKLDTVGTTKYFIQTGLPLLVSGTYSSINLYGGTDYTLTTGTISSPYISRIKAPLGFPLLPTKWTVETKNTSFEFQTTPTTNTWYNVGTNTLLMPIGVWDVTIDAAIFGAKNPGTFVSIMGTLSTANNTESDLDFTGIAFFKFPSGDVYAYSNMHREKTLALTSKATYYFNIRVVDAADSLGHQGSRSPLILRARCAYL